MLVASPEKELVGERVQVDLNLERPSPSVSLSGVVVYALDSGIGIRFEGVLPRHSACLKNYVQARRVGTVQRPS
jgi:hypothetical protein